MEVGRRPASQGGRSGTPRCAVTAGSEVAQLCRHQDQGVCPFPRVVITPRISVPVLIALRNVDLSVPLGPTPPGEPGAAGMATADNQLRVPGGRCVGHRPRGWCSLRRRGATDGRRSPRATPPTRRSVNPSGGTIEVALEADQQLSPREGTFALPATRLYASRPPLASNEVGGLNRSSRAGAERHFLGDSTLHPTAVPRGSALTARSQELELTTLSGLTSPAPSSRSTSLGRRRTDCRYC